VGGKIVYAAGDFNEFDVPLPPISPDWSPVRYFGGHQTPDTHYTGVANACTSPTCAVHGHKNGHDGKLSTWLGLDNSAKSQPGFENPWAIGCGCFAY
jgi:hypothetical protein